MPRYLVKENGHYGVFSTVVMANVSDFYESLQELQRHVPDATTLARHMTTAELVSLVTRQDVYEHTYEYNPKTGRIELPPVKAR